MVAARGEGDAEGTPEGTFAGWMQNFYLGKTAIMDIMNKPPPGWDSEGGRWSSLTTQALVELKNTYHFIFFGKHFYSCAEASA